MARQFSANDIVRLLLNVERSVVREALTDERLSAHEIWLEKGVILEEIRKITAPASPREEFVEIFAVVIRTALGAARILHDRATGPIIGRLFRVGLELIEHILETILDSLDELAERPLAPPEIPEFELFPSDAVDGVGPPDNRDTVRSLRVGLLAVSRISPLLDSADTKLIELFLEIDPVFALAQGPIRVLLSQADTARGEAQVAIEDAIILLGG